jgi:uncharacterized protein (DUF2141 family)
MNRFGFGYCTLISLILLASCARQTTPTGGPKDTIPPTLLNSIPKHGQTNFQGSTITLTFDEFVALNNPREQLIITPDLGKPVDAKTKKNQVILSLEDNLLDNTTYSINFRDAVQDITEKNPASMLKIAFSTGTYIDSLSIEGKVSDALTTKEIKDATVALFQTDTFDIFFHRPTYITKTDKVGAFKIENLKPGTYFIYAFEDKNKNLIVDSKTESYGFLPDTIHLKENLRGYQIPLVRLDSRRLDLTSARPSNTFFNIKTSKGLTDYRLTTPDDEFLISSFGEDQANIRVYNTFDDRDSVLVHFTARDSIQNTLDTTLYVKFQERTTRPEAFQVELQAVDVLGTKGTISARLHFNKPVLSVNFDSLYYRLDSINTIPFSQDDLQWDSIRNNLQINKDFDKKLLPNTQTPSAQQRQTFSSPASRSSKTTTGPQFYIGTAAFVSIERDSSKKITQAVSPSKLEETGVLLIEVQTLAPHFIVQLLNKEFAPISNRRNTKKFNFEDLKPGEYQIRLVIDRNNNGIWDPGNYFYNEPPEKIIFYRNEKNLPVVNLKANWELGPLLIKE